MKADDSKRQGFVFVGLGLEAVLLVVGAIFLGQKIDEAMGWQGLATVGLLVLGLMGWFVHLLRLIGQFSPKKNKTLK